MADLESRIFDSHRKMALATTIAGVATVGLAIAADYLLQHRNPNRIHIVSPGEQREKRARARRYLNRAYERTDYLPRNYH